MACWSTPPRASLASGLPGRQGTGLIRIYVVHVAHGKKAIETVRTVAPHLDAEREFRIIEQMELEDTDGLRVSAWSRKSCWRRFRLRDTPSSPPARAGWRLKRLQ